MVAYRSTYRTGLCAGLLDAPARKGDTGEDLPANVLAVSQTSIIAGVLIAGFIVFITTRGELPKYLQVIGV